MTAIINAAPMNNALGTQDKSTLPLTPIAEAIPTHLPKVFIYAQQGPTTPQLVTGDSRVQTYGADSFDMRLPYANHATQLSNTLDAAGNQHMIQRIIPNDANPPANFLLSLDVLPTMVPVYPRNADGTLTLDVNGNPLAPTGTTAGYLAKWVVTNTSNLVGYEAFGAVPTTAGDQTTTGSSPVQSQRYPILQFQSSDVGNCGNNRGINIWAPTTASQSPLNTATTNGIGAYQFYVSMFSRTSSTTTPTTYPAISGDQSVMVSFKPGAIDPVSDSAVYIGDVLLDAYRNLDDPTYPAVFGLFSNLYVYQTNIDTLLAQFYTAEYAYVQATGGSAAIGSDFTGAANEKYLFNIIGGSSTDGNPYTTFQFTSGSSNGITLNQYQNIYASGGSDGTMSNANFDASVAAAMAAYADPNNEVQDDAVNVESIIYDTGFALSTKYALLNFIAVRKDTCCILATYQAGQPPQSASDEESIATAVKARAQFFPESDYFGTPVMRALIMGRDGKVIGSQYNGRLPLTLELAAKSAAYMGSSTGSWKTGADFDGYPGSIVTTMTDVNITFTGGTVRNQNWATGLNWVQSYDRRQLFFPALKTVYNDDTSVLNSFLTVMAICEINKVVARVTRDFSGVSNLTDAQFIERVNDDVTAKLKNRFDGRFIIVPDCTITGGDQQRGFSSTTAVSIYAPNEKTVMTTYVKSYRISDYKS